MIGSIIQGGIGLIQGLAGLFMDPKRPAYEIPDAMKQMYKGAQAQANQTKIPGSDIVSSGMEEGTASMVSNVENVSGGNPGATGALAKIYAEQIKGQRGLAVDNARYHQQNIGQLRNAQMAMAGEQKAKWDYEKNQPYQEAAATKSALLGAGISNFTSSVNNIEGEINYKKMMEDMFGNGEGGGGGGPVWGMTGGANGGSNNRFMGSGYQGGGNSPYFTTYDPNNPYSTQPLNMGAPFN